MVIERENLLDGRGLPKIPMRLTELPFLMMKRAINLMNPAEKIRLAILSDEMEKNVRAVKADIIPIYTLRLTDSGASIAFEQSAVEVAVTDNFPAGDREGEKVTRREIDKWCDPRKEPTENVRIILNKLCELFFTTTSPPYLGLLLNVTDEQRIPEILKLPVFRDAEELTVLNHRLENKTIGMLIEFMENKQYIDFPFLRLPRDYYHEKALKCKHIHYADAWWMSVAQLLTMRQLKSVNLYMTSLDSSEIDILLKFWQKVEYAMFEEFFVQTREDYENLRWFDGVMELIGFSENKKLFMMPDDSKFYIMLSKAKSPTKQRQVAVIRLHENALEILARPANQFTQYVEILNVVNLLSEKDSAISNMKDESQMRYFGEGIDFDEEITALTAERQQIVNQLSNLNVLFDRGRATLIREQPEILVDSDDEL